MSEQAPIEHPTEPQYDFGGAKFDLNDREDREIVRFILSTCPFVYGCRGLVRR